MKIEDYTAYFLNIATIYTPIKRFMEADLIEMDSFLTELRAYKGESLVFVLESYARSAQDTPVANNTDVIQGAFVILDKLETRQNRLFSESANAEKAALAIRSRMLIDYETQCDILSGLQIGSFRMDKVGIYANNWTGWRVEFSMQVNEPAILNAEEWPNYTPYLRL